MEIGDFVTILPDYKEITIILDEGKRIQGHLEVGVSDPDLEAGYQIINIDNDGDFIIKNLENDYEYTVYRQVLVEVL